MRIVEMALLVTACLVLAGCSGSQTTDPTDDPGTSATSASTTNTVSGSGSNSNQANRAPTGVIQASTKSGLAPLAVNFTLQASDPDGDKLSWSLDVNGDGKADETGTSPAKFPAKVSTTYTQPGTFPVTYKVSDGKLESVFKINITAIAEEGPSALKPDRIYMSATLLRDDGDPTNPESCPVVAVYPGVIDDPGNGKANAGAQYAGFACSTIFEYTAPETIVAKKGSMVLQVVLGCAAPQALLGWGYDVSLNGESVASDAPVTLGDQCSSTLTTFSIDVPIGALSKDDVLSASVYFFNELNAPHQVPENVVYLKTGGEDGTAFILT